MDYFIFIIIIQPTNDLITYHLTKTLEGLAFIYTYVKLWLRSNYNNRVKQIIKCVITDRITLSRKLSTDVE
jgi:hypothetical protein